MDTSEASETQYSGDLNLTTEELNDLEDIRDASAAITYRNQDFDVAGLVRRLNSEDIIVPRIGSKTNSHLHELNAFQRGFVWNKKQMDSFIESLLLEYPIPGLFFVQNRDRRLIVLDGQQRLETLRRYYAGLTGERKYRLKLPGSPFDGLSYSELPDRHRRTLDNTYIATTVIMLDNTNESHNAVYDVFARLNSGGTQLTPHEIRMALYNGNLMNLIDEANLDKNWRELYGSREPNRRFRDHELVLRILALYLNESTYSKPLGRFLNDFSEEYRTGENEDLLDALSIFKKAVDSLASADLCNGAFSLPGKTQINTARADSIMVAIMHEISDANGSISIDYQDYISRLNQDENYIDSTTSATSDDAQVHRRIEIAREAIRNARR